MKSILINFLLCLENLKGMYFNLSTYNELNNVLLINGDLGYSSALIVMNHDNSPAYYVGILCGSNNKGNAWSFKLLHLSYNKNSPIIISGGNYNIPLKIKINYPRNTYVGVSITPLVDCNLNSLTFKLEKEEYSPAE